VEERREPVVLLLGIPPGHLPDVGECRLWIPGEAPGRQPRPRSRSCTGLARSAAAGTWILYRPLDRRFVHVRLVDERQAGVVVVVRVFDYASGRFLRYEHPEPEQIARPDPPRYQPRPPASRPRPEDRPRPQERPRPEEQPAPPVVQPGLPQGPRGAPGHPVVPDEQPRPETRPQPPEPQPRPNPHPALDIPPGHLPDPGACRVWIPGIPPGRQRHLPSGDCAGVTREAPAGSWVVYRPTRDRRLIHVRVVDDRRPGVVLVVRVFEAESGRFLRDEPPESDERVDAPAPPGVRPFGQPFRPGERPPTPVEPPPPSSERPQPSEERQPPPSQEEKPPVDQPKPLEPLRPPDETPRDERRNPADDRPRGRPDRGKPAASLDVAARELPNPGDCRVWIPGAPRGQQRHAASADCAAVTRAAPPASWVLYRPAADAGEVHVRVVDERRPGVIVSVRVFDAATGRLLREEEP
jgi:hypothetical protein